MGRLSVFCACGWVGELRNLLRWLIWHRGVNGLHLCSPDLPAFNSFGADSSLLVGWGSGGAEVGQVWVLAADRLVLRLAYISPFSPPCLTSTLRSTCHVCAWSSSWPSGSLLTTLLFQDCSTVVSSAPPHRETCTHPLSDSKKIC